MKRVLLVAFMAGCGAATAQAPAPTFATTAEIRALIDKAAATIKPGQPSLTQPLLSFAPYTAALEYRRDTAPPYIHKDQAEVFTVVEGEGTLTEGGQLTDAKAVDARNVTGSGISGGSERRIHAGDTFVILEGVPHGFGRIEGRLVLITIKVPRSESKP